MGDWPHRPVLITDVASKPYFRKGLIYVPLLSLDRQLVLAAPPYVAIEGAHNVLRAFNCQVLGLDGEPHRR